MNNKSSSTVFVNSKALDLEKGVFTWKDPKKIAFSIMLSTKKSSKFKANPYQSAMLMINFYLNKAGSSLNDKQKQILVQSKRDLKLYI